MYKLSEEEILDFAKKIYLEGTVGFADLCDPRVKRLTKEFLFTKVKETKSEVSLRDDLFVRI